MKTKFRELFEDFLSKVKIRTFNFRRKKYRQNERSLNVKKDSRIFHGFRPKVKIRAFDFLQKIHRQIERSLNENKVL